MSTPRMGGQRLVEVDALRGIAALAVVVFHYTIQYVSFFAPESTPSFTVPWGFHGVNLFFIISGFVIFMTLERTKRPMDFVVSRLSRLFPAYWTALLLTFGITHWLGLPGKLVGVGTLAANTVMLHGLFGVAHVDGVYWTLEVELLFYMAMFSLFLAGKLDRVHHYLWTMFLAQLTYRGAQEFFGVALLPWKLYHVLNLQFLPWFAIGISIYLGIHRHDAPQRRRAAITAAASMLTLALGESPGIGLLSLALGLLVWLAASGRAGWLRWPVLVWLGAVSYPLYLLHQFIGFSVMLQLAQLGIGTDAAIVVALALVLVLSQAVHRLVELPAMRRIRTTYKARLAAL